MAMDLTQFHQIFFEESLEGIATMEAGLLALAAGGAEAETVNDIFRAAHSIKGGAATFAFTEIAHLTHVMETLLDEVRAGHTEPTPAVVEALLAGVDCLRALLQAQKLGVAADEARRATVESRLIGFLGAANPAGQATTPTAATPSAPTPTAAVATPLAPDTPSTPDTNNASGWRIHFRPHRHLMQSGNDPLRILQELRRLGEARIVADTSALPGLHGLDPEDCYLSWRIDLLGSPSRAEVADCFAWVEGDCDLDISPLAGAPDLPALASPPSPGGPSGLPRSSASPASPASPKPSAPGPATPAGAEGGWTPGLDRLTSIRVEIDKVDALINMMGELVITQAMLNQLSEQLEIAGVEKLRDGLAQLARNTRMLQESAMGIRMLPIGVSFKRFPRLVHDLSERLGKKALLRLSGEQTELDKTVLEKISDPLVHLVRNALDHGIELPAARRAAGKPEQGLLTLNAFHQGGNIIIEVSDDGAGIDRERVLAHARARGLIKDDEILTEDRILDLIFLPGFTTSHTVSDVSGRGVGMDVVRKNIKDLGGVVEIRTTPGQGTTFRVRLPLTLSILDGQLVRVGEEIYILPLISIVESVQVDPRQLKSVASRSEVYRLRNDYIPVARLRDLFHSVSDRAALRDDGLLVIAEGDGQRIGLFVDDLLSQQQIVIKSLETNYQRVEGISGATILGDGRVALILDVAGLIALSKGWNKETSDALRDLPVSDRQGATPGVLT
jgi:two-component system chemotaxis sensor kinase CheA